MATKTTRKSVVKKASLTKGTKATASSKRVSQTAKAAAPTVQRKKKQPKLLAGGNPQIAKADGNAPVQSYIAAMPGWKHDVGKQIDALIEGTVPEVQKAVRWNTPFYGIEGRGWFAAFHCFNKYIKVTFLNGSSLRPLPPIASKQEEVRYFHIGEHEPFDEEQFVNWIRQASKLPGEKCF